MRPAHWLFLLLFWASALAAPALAEPAPQVSERFIRLSKRIAGKIAEESLRAACDKSDVTDKELCRRLANELVPLMTQAANGTFDEKKTKSALTRLTVAVVEAAIIEEGSAAMTELLLAPLREANIDEARRRQIERVLSCLTRTLIGDGAPAGCAGEKSLSDILSEVKNAAPTGVSTAEWTSAIDAVEILARLLERSVAGTRSASPLFDTVLALEREADGIESGFIGTLRSHQVFNEDVIEKAALDLSSLTEADCSDVANTVSRLRALKAERLSALVKATRIIHHQEEGNLKDLFPVVDIKRCPSSAKLSDYQTWLSARTTFLIIAGTVAAKPALLTALVLATALDYLRFSDEAALQKNARQVTLSVLKTALSMNEEPVSCSDVDASSQTVCRGRGGLSQIWTFDTSIEAASQQRFVRDFLENRATAIASERSCFFQAVAASLGEPVLVHKKFGAVCRQDALSAHIDAELLRLGLVRRPFAGPSSGASSFAEPTAAATEGRLLLSAERDESVAKALLEKISVPSVSVAAGDDVAELLSSAFLLLSRKIASAREYHEEIFSAAVTVARPAVEKLLTTSVPALQHCDKENISPACALLSLARASLAPILTGAISDLGSDEILELVIEALAPQTWLRSSFLLVTAGPGYNALIGKDGTTHHLTVLDKWGIAYKPDDDHLWAFGLFAGGFLDAVVRAAATNDVKKAHVLLGGSVGYTAPWKALPLGIEGHVAWAPAFEMASIDDISFFALGVTVTAPLELVFYDGDEK